MVNKKSLATFVRTLGNQVIAGFKHFLNNVKIGGDLIHDPDPLGSTATNLLTVDAQGVVRKATSLAGATGTVTSVALTAPSAFTVTGSPITTSGTIAIGAAGTASQYVRGDGQLADFPISSGGGSSVSYYLNGSVNQGTLGGNVYREFSKTPIVGAGTDFTIAANGYIAQFITDANDPSLLEIPGGNWNIEFWFSASSSGGSPSFYVELSKYDGTTFTPIANNSAFPEFIAFGTTISQYYTALAVPQTTLAVTDRLALRVYVVHSGRTITLHTEDNHLCQVITTFSTGLNALNGLTKQVQYFAVGTSGADFNISSVTDTHTFNIPTASGANRGLLSTSDWTNFTAAYNDKINSASVTGTTTKTLTLTQQDGGTVTASWTDYDTAPVASVFGRTGAVIAVSGDYNTSQVTENTNLYFTNARARTAISLTTTGTSGAATYDNSTGVLNVPQYQSVLTNPVTGTGTTNYVTKWTGTNTVNNSQIFDNGTNVGIGTASPAEKLHVAGRIMAAGSGYTLNPTAPIFGQYSSTRGYIQVPTNGQFEIWSGGTAEIATFYENKNAAFFGNVGIGTTSPGALLEANGVIRSTRTGAASQYVEINGGDAVGPFITAAGANKVLTIQNNSTTSSVIRFNQAVASEYTWLQAGTERMRISSTGNVGIGTTSPGQKLQIGDGTATGSQYVRIFNSASDIYLGQSASIIFGFSANSAGFLLSDNASFPFGVGTIFAQPFVIGTNNTERLRITSAGNVGIGTTSPGARLEVVANGESGRFNSSDTNGSFISFRNNGTARGYIGSGFHLWGSPNNIANNLGIRAESQLDLGIGSSVTMTINSSGNVGIGTTSPGTKLDVSGIARATSLSTANGLGLNVAGYAFLSQTTSGVMTFLGHNIRASDSVANTAIVQNAGWISSLMKMYYSDGITFHTDSTVYAAGATYPLSTSERMRITPAGNVGIGTTSPLSKFQVYDTTAFAYSAAPNVSTKIGASGTGGSFLVNTPSANSSYESGLAIDGTYTSGKSVININAFGVYSGGPYSADLAFKTSTNTTLSEKMRITNAGDVGIGTTSPSAKLHVIGNVTVSSTLLTANAKLTGTLTDSFNQVGTAGQVLSSTGTGTQWVTGGGGGGSTIIVKDEGTTIGSSFTTLNFVGNNIQASASGSTAVVTAYNNAGTGSLYANDTTTQYAPTASFADVEINAVTVEAAAPDTAAGGQKLIAIVTFGVENVSSFDGFNNFDFRLYNSSGASAVADTTHSWSSYMSKDAGVKTTVFTFHIPLYDGVGVSETITVQAKQSTAYTPEIYYCALTFIEGTN